MDEAKLESVLKDRTISSALAGTGLNPSLTYAPPWHDLGKAHEKFVAKLLKNPRGRMAEWLR